MKIKFELDIGANEVLRLKREAEAPETRSNFMVASGNASLHDLIAKLGGEAREPMFYNVFGKSPADPGFRDRLTEIAKSLGVPTPDELDAMMAKQRDRPAPPRKQGQDARKPLTAVLERGDVEALLYALDAGGERIAGLGSAMNLDLAKRVAKLRDQFRGVQQPEVAKAAE